MDQAHHPHRCLSHWNGSWVYHGAQLPSYQEQAAAAARTNPQSVNIRQSPMCRRQQSWKWRWESRDRRCPFHHPSPSELCERLRGRRILLYGDSLTQQFFVSLASLTGGSGATQAMAPSGCERTRHLECLRLCGDNVPKGDKQPAFGTLALICQRTKFGMALDEVPTPPENCTIKPSTVAPLHETFPPSCIRAFDLVIVSTVAHWVGNDGALRLSECLTSRRPVDAASADASAYVQGLYKRQMQRDAMHLQRTVSPARLPGENALNLRQHTRIFFRTSPTGYPTPDLLPPDTSDGAPPVFTKPSRDIHWARTLAARNASRFNHHLFARFNAIARHAYKSAGLDIFDAEVPMLHRVDGHLDLLHYCLPGPADFYSEALWNYMVDP